MTNDKIKESIQIAEELAKELCTANPSTSLLANDWKEQMPALYEELRKQESLPREISFHETIDVEKALKVTHLRMKPLPRRFSIATLGMVASFLLLIGASALWLWTKDQEETPINWTSSVPGATKSSILAHGDKSIELSENHFRVEGNQLISTTQDGKRNVAINLKPDNEFNRLSVPAGGEHQLTLEDGTVVRVNTASELLFPTHFKKQVRQVRLKGEAYFKVETDKASPFVVLLGRLNVQVTGTSFNVKAYEEDNEIHIALTEGSVSIREGQRVLATLTSGQLFTYQKASQAYSVSEVNIAAATGWIDGRFVFYNETIENIMRDLSRWYDVDIRVSNEIKNLRYSGMLLRKQPITEMLYALSLTKELDFKIHKDKKVDAIGKKNQ